MQGFAGKPSEGNINNRHSHVPSAPCSDHLVPKSHVLAGGAAQVKDPQGLEGRKIPASLSTGVWESTGSTLSLVGLEGGGIPAHPCFFFFTQNLGVLSGCSESGIVLWRFVFCYIGYRERLESPCSRPRWCHDQTPPAGCRRHTAARITRGNIPSPALPQLGAGGSVGERPRPGGKSGQPRGDPER